MSDTYPQYTELTPHDTNLPETWQELPEAFYDEGNFDVTWKYFLEPVEMGYGKRRRPVSYQAP